MKVQHGQIPDVSLLWQTVRTANQVNSSQCAKPSTATCIKRDQVLDLE